jgi:hypothetical protein
MSSSSELRWARRVRQDAIRRLYALDAQGVVDEELIDDVGYAFYARCESIRVVTEAHAGRVACPRCGSVLEHHWQKDEVLDCTCGWSLSWAEYHKSFKGKQLHGGSAYPAFLEFLRRWPLAQTPRDKMLAIDAVVHACHGSGKFGASRPAAVNVIEGSMGDVLDLLDGLAYGDATTAGLTESRRRFVALGNASLWGSWQSRARSSRERG